MSVRLLIPAGFMPNSGGHIALNLCSGVTATASVTIDLGKHQKQDQSPRETMPCAFAAAAMPIVSGAAPALLAVALVYIIERGLASDPETAVRYPLRLRPPLRGPPII